MRIRPLFVALALVAAPALPAQIVLEPALAAVPLGQDSSPVATGDFDEDGRLDVAFVTGAPFGELRVMLGDGDGGFALSAQAPAVNFGTSVVVLDADVDGHLDVLVGAQLHPGNGDGTLAAPLAVPDTSFAVASADLDVDGVPDLVFVRPGAPFTPDADLVVLHGVGDGTFVEVQAVPTVVSVTSVGFADLDADGALDLLTTLSNVRVDVFLGTGDGLFATSPIPTRVAGFLTDHAFADFDDDGQVDVAVATSTGGDGVAVLLGNGDGTFAPEFGLSFPGAPVGVIAADLDLDGAIDLAAFGSTSDDLLVRRGLGDGTFALDVTLSGAGASAATRPVVGLVDTDLFPDLLHTTGTGASTEVTLVRNHTYAPDSPYADLGGELAGAAGFPVLLADGVLEAGTPFAWRTLQLVPGRAVYVVVGLGLLDAPFKGGTMKPTPDLLIGPFIADGAGAATFGGTWPSLNGGYDVFVQAWIVDASGPAGFAASPGLVASLPAAGP